MLDQKKHEIIMNHYRNPQNQTDIKHQGYWQFEKTTSYCGDQIIIQIKLDSNQRILDLKYEANACSICCASASLMSIHMKKLDKEASLRKIKHFIAMIKQETYHDNELNQDLKTFDIVYQLPHKINCVLLPWQTLEAFWSQ
ncbi:Fe-S cluster assembly sulfur transfer protein SufU [Candidatus Phytoplasma meliae]|nr:SUF system NifU family Fe-S cluster assembly protein [Candidatus Phytoplasma meliae]